MPIRLATPIVPDAITHAEITAFNVDLSAGVMIVRLADLTSSGRVVSEHTLPPIALFDAAGSPLFTADEYRAIKGAIYRLLIADGLEGDVQ